MGKWWWCGRLCTYAETLFSEEDLRLTRLRALLQSIPHVQTCSPVESADPQGQEVYEHPSWPAALFCRVFAPPAPFSARKLYFILPLGVQQKKQGNEHSIRSISALSCASGLLTYRTATIIPEAGYHSFHTWSSRGNLTVTEVTRGTDANFHHHAPAALLIPTPVAHFPFPHRRRKKSTMDDDQQPEVESISITVCGDGGTGIPLPPP